AYCCSLFTRRATLISTLFPYTTLFRSDSVGIWLVCMQSTGHGKDVQICSARRPLVDLTAPHSTENGTRLRLASGAGRRNPVRERSEEHTSELQSLTNLVCRLLLEKKKT